MAHEEAFELQNEIRVSRRAINSHKSQEKDLKVYIKI
jgi:hypothetical protein